MVKILHNIKLVLRFSRMPFFLLRGNKIKRTADIGKGVVMRGNTIGENCFIGSYCIMNNADVGNYTCIAPSCQIGGMEHSFWSHSISPKLSSECISDRRTTIGHDVWLAAGVIVRQGVTIGDGAVIGANSFVNTDIPPYAIAFGTPAKVYKYRFDAKAISELKESEYWKKSSKEAKAILRGIKLDY